MTLVNSLPKKVEARKDEQQRQAYFSKRHASSTSIQPIDGLISAMADNIGYLQADKFVDAIQWIVNDPQAFRRAEACAEKAIKEAQSSSDIINKPVDTFRDAFEKISSEESTTKVLGSIKDDIGVDPGNRSEFLSKVYAFANDQIEDDTVLSSIDIDEEEGTFEAILKNVDACSDEEKTTFAEVLESGFKKANIDNFGDNKAEPFGKKEEVETEVNEEESKKEEKTASRSEAREDLIRQAQMMGGQMPIDMGAGGAGGASLPTPPGEMGAPVESFGQEPDMGLGDDDLAGDLQPKPPGSLCPVCTSDDVDVVAGKGKCNNCVSEFQFKVSVDVTKWSGLTDDGDAEELEGEGEGFALPEEGMEESLPVAASTKLRPEALRKMAESEISFGSVSPYSGATDTYYVGETADGASEFHCYSSGQRYFVRKAQKGDSLYAQWEWTPRFNEPCTSCSRMHKKFAKALESVGLDDDKFSSLSLRQRGDVILSMHDNGSFKNIKTASKSGSVLGDFRNVYAFGTNGKFPAESCREKLARRFGEDAIALSGPCSGSNLADCVCKKLSTAGMYSDGIAIKIASLWSERDACAECVEDFVRIGKTIEDSALICDSLKSRYAQAIELLADDMGDENFGEDEVVFEEDPDTGVEEDSFFEEEGDPFGSDAEEQGFVSVEVPLDVLEGLKESVDEALGEGDEAEGIGDLGDVVEEGTEVEVVEDEELSEDVGEAVDEAVDTANEVVEEVSDGIEDVFASKNDKEDVETSSISEDKESMTEVSEDIAEAASEEEIIVAESEALGNNLKHGRISRTGEINLDLNDLAASLNKSAGDSKLVHKNVQDDKDIQQISDASKSKMGQEDKLTLADPDVPSAGTGATMGKETDDVVPTEDTHVPAGGPAMGHESEQGLTPEKGHDHTGGDEGAGSSRSAGANEIRTTKSMSDNLAERLVRVASESKLKPPAPLEDDGDIQPVQGNKDHTDTPEGSKITPRESGDGPDIPEAGNGAQMGHESDAGSVPKSPADHPDIPIGGGKSPKYDKNDRWDAEKQDHDKGTVIASGDEESLVVRRKAAETLVGKMIVAGIISPDQISQKIEEISRYEIEQISDYEKVVLGAATKKGLNTVSQGSQTPLVIPAKSNDRGDPATELRSKLQSMFTMDRQNRLADDDPNSQIRMNR